jgi:pimeloyl-ACP methyl ester carboxylesterase
MDREAGDGEPLLCLGDIAQGARALLSERRRLITLEPPKDAQAIAASLIALGIDRFDLLGQGASASLALRLALERPNSVRALVLLGPTAMARDGAPADGADATLLDRLGEIAVPSLALFGTRDALAPPETARHYRERIPACNLVFVYDASHAMAAERPEAVASLVLDFLERHDLFLVRRESDLIYP